MDQFVSSMSHFSSKVHESVFMAGHSPLLFHSLSKYLLRTVSVLGAADRRVNKTQNKSQHQTASILVETHSRFWLNWDLSSMVHGCRSRTSWIVELGATVIAYKKTYVLFWKILMKWPQTMPLKRILMLINIYWRIDIMIREGNGTPLQYSWPGKSHGWRSLEGCSPWGHEEAYMTERRHFHFSLSCIGEGNGNPLQCSCLGNPRDGGAWWAAVYGVAQSRTRLEWLRSRHHDM